MVRVAHNPEGRGGGGEKGKAGHGRAKGALGRLAVPQLRDSSQPAEVAEGNSGRSVLGEPPGMLFAHALPSGPKHPRATLSYFLDAL